MNLTQLRKKAKEIEAMFNVENFTLNQATSNMLYKWEDDNGLTDKEMFEVAVAATYLHFIMENKPTSDFELMRDWIRDILDCFGIIDSRVEELEFDVELIWAE